MGVCGSGAIIDFVGRLLYGPKHYVDYIHVTHNDNGSKDLGVYIRKETFKTVWRRSKTPASRLYTTQDDPYGRLHPLKHLKNLDDGINCDGHRIVPVNEDGHVIMENGTVYDRKNKTYLEGQSTKTVGYATLRPRLLKQARMICMSPAILVRLSVVLAISAVLDTGIYELGKYKGYREAQKGKIPLKLLKGRTSDKAPSEERILANALSPIPLTFKTFNPSVSDIYVHPTQPEIAKLQAMNASLNQQPAQNTQLTA